jgi:two-component system NtrC family response regulator
VTLIAKALLRKYASDFGKKTRGFSAGALQAIGTHEWPGNIREMQNRIKRAVIMANLALIQPSDLELGPRARHAGIGLKDARDNLERELIHRALAKHGGNLTRAAEELDISRPTMYDLMDKLRIKKQ